MAMDQRPDGAGEEYPERRMIAQRLRAQRRSMARAGLFTGVLLVGLTVARSLLGRVALRKPWYERIPLLEKS